MFLGAAIPKIVRCDGLHANFNGARDDVFVRVRVLADKNCRHAVLRTAGTGVKIVQAGYGIRGGRADLTDGQYAPLWIAEQYKIARRRAHFSGKSEWFGNERLAKRIRGLDFFNLLRMDVR